MRTSNPALHHDAFARATDLTARGFDRMSVSGAVNKTGLLVLVVTATALWSWSQAMRQFEPSRGEPLFLASTWMWIGMLSGFILALITVFKHRWSPVTAPLYAAAEGLFLGALSAGFEVRYPGIVLQAILGTFGTLIALLAAYRSGMIRATENFKLGIVAATGGIALVYLISLGLGVFGVRIPYIHESGPVGIGFSLVVVAIAALNLVLDFDFIESGEHRGAPKYMEWYAAFGLLVTLVWLYLEILRLLSKGRRR